MTVGVCSLDKRIDFATVDYTCILWIFQATQAQHEVFSKSLFFNSEIDRHQNHVTQTSIELSA